jgi:DNA-binding GntR family transcriptional regulator
MEEAVRNAVTGLRPGDVITAHQLARSLDLDRNEVGVLLDVLAAEGLLIPEHAILAEAAHAQPEIHYRVPLNG